MKIADFQNLPIRDKIALINFLKSDTELDPYGYGLCEDDRDRLLNYLECGIVRELNELAEDLRERAREQEHREDVRHWTDRFKKLKEKYPGRYRIYFSTVYTVLKESDDGCTIDELRDALSVDDWRYADWDIFSKLGEVYMYNEYRKKDKKIWYGTRSMTIGLGPYDAWKLAFADTTQWKLEIALQGYYH